MENYKSSTSVTVVVAFELSLNPRKLASEIMHRRRHNTPYTSHIKVEKLANTTRVTIVPLGDDRIQEAINDLRDTLQSIEADVLAAIEQQSLLGLCSGSDSSNED